MPVSPEREGLIEASQLASPLRMKLDYHRCWGMVIPTHLLMEITQFNIRKDKHDSTRSPDEG
jgi:hypothetical protein